MKHLTLEQKRHRRHRRRRRKRSQHAEALQPFVGRHSTTLAEESDRPGDDDVDADRSHRLDVRRRVVDRRGRDDQRGVLLRKVILDGLQLQRPLLRKPHLTHLQQEVLSPQTSLVTGPRTLDLGRDDDRADTTRA